jgi:hypothetical protein
VSVKQVGESESMAKTLLFGSKDLATSLKNKEQILMIPEDNKLALNTLNFDKKVPFLNMAFKKECLFCEFDSEIELMNSPAINLVERKAPELKYFANLLKNENFIDYSVENLQGKNLGYQILISNDSKFLNAVDIATNKNLVSLDKTSKFLGLSIEKSIGLDMVSKIANAYKPEIYGIKMISVKEQKKDKINEVYVYSPIGFDVNSKFDIVTLVKETVDGEDLYRNNKIGEGKLGKIYSTNLAEMKIKDGEKELFAAIAAKQEFYFVYPTKK